MRRVGLIAGEASGDLLGASLMAALRAHWPDVQFSGVGGPAMLEQGFHSLVSMDRLAVMGLVEPLQRLPELLRLRRRLRRHFLAEGCDLVVGIDSPDFNLGLEQWLRRRGVATAHYVSPSVWAWRQGRIRTIARAVDLMLVLFPFEEPFYREHGVAVCCVGHPMADQLPMEPATEAARAELGLSETARVVALMPGSRGGEVTQLGGRFLAAASWLHRQRPGWVFLLPAASEERHRQLAALLAEQGAAGMDLRLLAPGRSRLAMAAADAVLMASGTTTLEAMLLKRPMVVAYRMAPWSYRLLAPWVRTPYIALPNLLAGEELVPEFIQDEVVPETLARSLLEQLESDRRAAVVEVFEGLHRQLRRGASQRAAAALVDLVAAREARS